MEQVEGAFLRVPDLLPESAWPLAQVKLDESASVECQQAAGAQHLRNFILRADYGTLHWSLLFLPLFITWYTDDQGQPHSLYINGQSGMIGGMRLASQRKGWQMAGQLLGKAAVAFILGLIFAGFSLVFPPASLLGVLLGIVAILIACYAIVPVVWPWQWNRGQMKKQ